MILSYFLFVALAVVLSATVAAASAIGGAKFSYLEAALSTVFAVPFMSLVVVRLPIFRRYYTRDIWALENRLRNMMDQQAAPVASAFVTGCVLAGLWYIAGSANVFVPAFCGAVAAGCISFCHDPFF